MHKQARNSDSS